MPANRFFVSDAFHEHATVEIRDQEFQHLVKVMRTRVGEKIELVNGQGALAQAEVSSISKREASCQILSIDRTPLPKRKVILCQAITRLNRLDFIVEKGTELGVTDFILFSGMRGEKSDLSTNQISRLENLTISALKQSGRLHLPILQTEGVLSKWKQPVGTLFFGDVRPDAKPLLSVLSNLDQESDVVLFVGPESGFTEQEHQLLIDWNALPIKLHENILRSDTAALCGLSLLTSPTS